MEDRRRTENLPMEPIGSMPAGTMYDVAARPRAADCKPQSADLNVDGFGQGESFSR